MAATVQKGYTFSSLSDSVVNASDLLSLVQSATISNIDRTCIDNTNGYLGLRRSSLPTDLGVLEPWCHEDVQWWCTKLASGLPASLRVGGITVQLSASSATVEPGELVGAAGISGGVVQVTKATTGSRYNVLGVAAFRMLASDYGVCICHGVTRAKFATAESGTDFGEPWGQSTTTDGQAATLSVIAGQQVGVTISNIDASSRFAWVMLRR